MAKVVIFNKDGVRIYHADDVKDLAPYVNRKDCLIDPVYPRGVPPHLWKLVDGKIQVEEAPTLKRPKKRLLLTLSASLLALLLLGMVMHAFSIL